MTLPQRELRCQHHYHLVESWCKKYIETERRCTPIVVTKQYWGDEVCCMFKFTTWSMHDSDEFS
ncbi:hypothetical protein E4U21_005396 [Claviceps maximensis]|nr:hypothetical protein E4U21_005396 [Claviceps maximensis]